MAVDLIVKPERPSSSSSLTRRERLDKRFDSAKEARKPYDKAYEEIERLCLPSRSEHLANGPLKSKANTAKQDTAGIIAGRTLVHGMSTGLSNPARPWFKLRPSGDPDLAEYQPVKEWLFTVERILYWFFATTNYYDANKIAYSELAHMGYAVTLGVEHRKHKAVFHSFDHGECWIAEDDGLRVGSLFIETTYTVDQMVRKFPWNRLTQTVRDAYDKSNITARVKVRCIIEENDDRDARLLDSSNKAWRSTWWEVGQNDKNILLKEGGFDSKPFSAPRWETMGSETYSSSCPGFNALPDLRELEFNARRKGRAMDLMVRPPLFIPAGLQQTMLSVDPGSMNFINEMQGKVDALRPDPNVLTVMTQDSDRLTRRVNQLFYADLWMAVTDMEGVQPRNEQELMYRNEEKLTQLGPVVDRVNIEKLEVDIDRGYSICDNLGLIPPAPPELQGVPLSIDFVSILAQAQLATSNSSIERAAQFVGFLTGMYPDAAIKFDAEQAIDEFARNSNTSPKIIRSDEIVAEMKEQMIQKQQMEQAAQMAPAVAQGAQAAELLSRTQVGSGGSMLDQMMGGVA